MSKYLKVIYQVKLLNKKGSLPPILTNIPSTTWRYRNEFKIFRLLEVSTSSKLSGVRKTPGGYWEHRGWIEWGQKLDIPPWPLGSFILWGSVARKGSSNSQVLKQGLSCWGWRKYRVIYQTEELTRSILLHLVNTLAETKHIKRW